MLMLNYLDPDSCYILNYSEKPRDWLTLLLQSVLQFSGSSQIIFDN